MGFGPGIPLLSVWASPFPVSFFFPFKLLHLENIFNAPILVAVVCGGDTL